MTALSQENPVTIGKDVSVFTITAGGSFSFLGKWESLTIDFKYTWATATPADALTPYKRQTMYDFTGNLAGFMDGSGSELLQIAMNNLSVFMVFTEVNSGLTMQLFAGITSAGFTANQEAWKDKLDFESIGLYQGGAPLQYTS